jgi:hypothetical protein
MTNRAESDVFMLSNSDDLVPALDEDGGRFEDRSSAPGYVIQSISPAH